MRRIHIIGRKNHGKTQLVLELVQELSRRGLRVGTIKHTHHRHELDTPGKDSHRHRMAGAKAVGIVSPSTSAVFLEVDRSDSDDDRYAALASMFDGCELVVVEGDSQTSAFKIEVWRACQDTTPLALEDRSIRAIVSDDALKIDAPQLARSDVAGLAGWILARLDP